MNIQDILRRLLLYPIAFTCGLFSVALIVIFFFRGSAIPELQEQLVNLENERDTLSTNRINAIGLEEELGKLERFLEMVEEQTAVSDERSANISYFYDLESTHDIIMGSFKQGSAVLPEKKSTSFDALKNFALIPFELTAAGRYEDIMKYSLAIQRGSELAKIRRFSLASAVELDGNVNLDLEVLILGERVGK